MQIPENTENENNGHPHWVWRDPGMFIIGCDTDGCFGNINHKTMVFLTPEDAVKVWNRRK